MLSKFIQTRGLILEIGSVIEDYIIRFQKKISTNNLAIMWS